MESRVGGFRFPDGSTQFTAMDATGAVTGAIIAADAVGASELATNAVDTTAVVNGAITAAKINSNEVQRRIAGSCDSGQFVIAINVDGTLVCAAIYDFLFIPPVISTLDDPANSVGQHTSIAIGTDGLPVISYLDGTDGALKVVKCFKPGCN